MLRNEGEREGEEPWTWIGRMNGHSGIVPNKISWSVWFIMRPDFILSPHSTGLVALLPAEIAATAAISGGNRAMRPVCSQVVQMYEAWALSFRTGAITGLPATYYTSNWGWMKGIDVLFHMVYGSFMCSEEALSDRSKCEGCLQISEMLTVRSSKHNSPVLMWKMEFQRLSACHLAVCWNWAGYHTSFERGDSGLPADIRIRTMVQLIGILWSYFEHFWGLSNWLILMVWHLAISHWNKDCHISFQRRHQYLSFSPNYK